MSPTFTRRLFIRQSALLLGGMSLIQACAPAPSPEGAAAPAKPAEAAKPAAAPAVSQPVTITYWDFITPGDNTPRGQSLANNLKAFEQANPDIKVNIQVLPSPQLSPQLLQAAAAGKTPDVCRMNTYFIASQVAAGSIAPLDQYVASWDKSDWLIDWKLGMYNGQKMGIPYEHRVQLLAYRKKILEDRGIAVPKTMEEVLAAAKKIGRDNPMGFSVGLSKEENGVIFTAIYFVCMMLVSGGQMFNDDDTAAFNTEAGVRAFQWVDDLYKQGGTSMAAVNQGANNFTDGLAANTIAMGIIGGHRLPAVRTAGAKEDLDYTGIPGWQDGKPAGPNAQEGFFLTIGKDSTNKEAAIRYIEFMTSPKVAAEMAKGGEMPPRKSSYKDPFFSTPEAREIFRYKEILEGRPGYVRYPEKWADAGDLLVDGAQRMVLQNRPAKEMVEEAATKYNALLKK